MHEKGSCLSFSLFFSLCFSLEVDQLCVYLCRVTGPLLDLVFRLMNSRSYAQLLVVLLKEDTQKSILSPFSQWPA